MRERGKVFGFLKWILYAASVGGMSSIVEWMPEVLHFIISFVFVETDLLVEHVAIQLLLFEFFSTDVLVFAERIHFIEK